jgi:hypothetical protein
MGTHWAYDTKTHPVLSHITANLVPVMPMYSDQTGYLTAFLVHSNFVEKVWPFGYWEGPLTSGLFCYNLCQPCTWDSNVFSTMHFYFTDPALNICEPTKCPNGTL